MPRPRNSTSPGTRMRPASSEAASAAASSAPATRMSCPSGIEDGGFSPTPACESLPPSMGGAHTDMTAALLAALAAVAVAVGAITLVWVDLLPTGRNPARDAVSDYGAGPYRLFYTVIVCSLGVGALLLLVALARGTGVPNGGLIWLGVFGATRIAVAFFPHHPEGRPVTPAGRVHLALAAAAFAAIAFAAVDLAPALADEPGWGAESLIGALRWAVVITAVATLAARVILPVRRTTFGLIERLLYASFIAFLIAVAVEAVIVLG